MPADKLSYVVVEDVAASGAFNEAVRSSPPFEAVIHAASPFHFNTNDPEKNLLNPVVKGTTEILKANGQCPLGSKSGRYLLDGSCA